MKQWITPTLITAIALGFSACSNEEKPATAPPAPVAVVSGALPITSSSAKVTPQTAPAKLKGHVVGKVGDYLFTDQDIDAEFSQMPANFQKMKDNPAMRANILNNLMTRHALAEKARQLGIADDPVIRGKIARAQSGILLQELNQRQRSKFTTADDKALQAYYQANIARFSQPEQMHVRHILVKSAKAAKRLLRKLKKGADFAKLAKEKSEDQGSKMRGGDIGSFPRGRMAPPFEKAAFALAKDGDRAGPIKTRFGYHIIERLGHTPAGQKPFDQVKTQIRHEMQQQAFRGWVEDVKKEMSLTVTDPRYQRGHRPMAPRHAMAPTTAHPHQP
ncbi:MAG: peptidylprolyl isomerase [Mariprofundales bacterium]